MPDTDQKDKKKTVKLDVKISLGPQSDANNPLILFDNSLSDRITNLINFDVGLQQRFNVVSQEDYSNQLESFPLEDHKDQLFSLFSNNIKEDMWKQLDSKKILLRSFILKSMFQYSLDQENSNVLLNTEKGFFSNLLKYGN